MNELVVLRRELEKGSQTKQDKENEIMAKLQDQMISNKAAKYFLQLRAKLQNTMLTLVRRALPYLGLMGARFVFKYVKFLSLSLSFHVLNS